MARTLRTSLVLAASLLAGGCGSSQAERVCTIAQAVAADSSIAAAQRGAEWAKRAHAAVDDPRLRPTLERVASSGVVDRARIEAELSKATDAAWTCPALDEL